MERTLFDAAEEKDQPVPPNAPTELSVSQISQQLKSCVENNFNYVRVRGELSRVTVARSGHLYTSLKDDSAVLDAICWKGNLSRLSVRPEEGLDVICTGRLTTYPGRSNYQMIVETMEMAGEGALLKMLEERRRKLAAEGLFDESSKKPLPFLPRVIGVVSSPTGAVIRDIMHRISDRFPCRVLLWPAVVQGQQAAEQVAAGILGFNSLPAGHRLKPDLLIVARGGGSLEDLMPFNEEIVVRATAASKIPIISAIGHETDTTLIDFAADLRAPTPTAAAEKAVPVKTQIIAAVLDYESRMMMAMQNKMAHFTQNLDGLGRGLGDPERFLDTSVQRLDQASIRLDLGLKNWLSQKQANLQTAAAGLSCSFLLSRVRYCSDHLQALAVRLERSVAQNSQQFGQRLSHLSSLLESLSFKKVLERGFVLVKDAKTGQTVKQSASVLSGQDVQLQFHDGELLAVIKKET